MTPPWLHVLDPKSYRLIYETLVRNYWNWLLSEKVDVPVGDYKDENDNTRKVLYMRMIYGYANRWDVSSHELKASRKNVSSLNRMGGPPNTPIKVEADTAIFLPVIDSCEGDFDRDVNGQPLTPEGMNYILNRENEDVAIKINNGKIRPTIRKINENKSILETPGEIVNVKDLHGYLISVPGDDEGTFPLEVPDTSRLAQSLEFEIAKGQTYNARAEGTYIIFTLEPGKYQIRSSAEGLREYKSFMNYYVEVEVKK